MLQKYMPLIFGFIYLNVAAILNVYFIVSSAIRIGTQEVLFRKGIVAGPNSPAPSGSGKSRSIAAAKDNGIESTEKALPKPKSGSDGKSGTPKATGSKASTNGKASSSNGSTADSDSGSDAGDAAKKQHPRSKAKKERKAR
jgi:hypothetical protein